MNQNHKSVLIVDDSGVVREIMREVLEDAGYEVFEAAHGQLGLEQARRQVPDIVLCDINMPVLDGFGFVQAARADPQLRTVPILMVTAMAERKSMRRAMDAGADDFLSKPFTPEELIEAVSGQLARRERHTAETAQSLDVLRGALMSTVPHELRTPLTTILGLTQLLVERDEQIGRDRRLDMLRDISGAAQRLSRTIGRFMEWAELNAAAPGALAGQHRASTGALVEQVADPAFRQRVLAALPAEFAQLPHSDRMLAGRMFRCEVPAAELGIGQDDLQRLVVELVGNAVKFSVPGAPVVVDGQSDGRHFLLDVRNHGPALPPDVHRQQGALIQFDRGHQEQQGSGMGLALCHLIARRHGASLHWVRTDGAPNTVRIKVPLAAPPTPSAPPGPVASPPSRGAAQPWSRPGG
ncbi:phospho-acceptor domain-containing protein [Sphaerotilus hippei]|uniref:histidine kinase n=1 Tax=Sphaerotilus hippei TaxID=744406 RepID=A0A318H4N5_9BURK|nr:hybrid sensor histidine kinase/response regulator [Sphaerotilus hippei]PXW98782.1 phospho-acceptor domain-containing protein [Sphaerotilus hippei]